MSTGTSVDVSRIQDEELLRKMWQDTEDFGKKKEIRSHMYKLREERLRNFYSSGSDTTSEHSQTVSNIHESNAKDLCGSIHADSLKDYSFSSLKSKEIRDSESPTKEIQYRIPDKNDGNQGWNIISTNEKIPGGYSTSQVAVTSGSEKIDGGVANYLAECAQNALITSEGDDKNYVKSFKTNSKNAVQQVAKREDDSGNFQSFSNFSNSSSKVVTQHQSSSQDIVDNSSFPSNFDDSVSKDVEYKTYITDVPAELKANPNYVDGKTKVTTETRTLEDGTTVTTTRYETKYGSSDMSSQNYSTASNQEFVSKGKTDYDSKVNKTNISDTSKIIVQRVPNLEQTNITKNVSNKAIQEKQNQTDSQTRTTKSIQVVIDRNDQSNFDETRENVTETFKNDLLQKNLKNNENVTKTTVTEKIVKSDDQGFAKKIENERVISTKTEEIPRYIEIIPTKPSENRETRTKIDKTEKNITIRKHNIPEQVDQEFVIHVTPTPSKPDNVITTIIRTVDDYNNKQNIKVHQVTEQVNKRISVEVSPTHQAFARSLRAVSPDHDKKRGSNRSLKSSVSSLRSSKSPEKNVCDRQPHNRSTPERKFTTPSRETSPTKNINSYNISPTAKQVPRNPSRNRSTSPTSDAETNRTTNKKIQRITVDVEETSVHRTGNKPITRNSVDRSPTSPTKPFVRESPTKEKPQERQDRPFKRRDTYEERCKQILGITEKDSPKTDTNKRNVTKDVKITKELSRDKLIKSTSRSPEKTCKPTEDNPKSSPKGKTPSREDYPTQKRQVPNSETHVKRNPSKDNLNAPKKGVEEPELTKRYVKPLCDGDDFPHLQKQRPTCFPTRKPNDLEPTHKIVKKDNPYKEYPDSVDDEKESKIFGSDFYAKNVQVDENDRVVTTKHQTSERKSPSKEPIERNRKNFPANENTEYVTKILTSEQTNTFTRPNKSNKKSPSIEDVCKPKQSVDEEDFYHKNIRTDENQTITTEFKTIDRSSPGRRPTNKKPTLPNKKVDETERFTKTTTTEQTNTFTRPNKPDKKYPDNEDVCRPKSVDRESDIHDFYRKNIRTNDNETIRKEFEIIDGKSPEREPSNRKPTSPNKRVDETESITKTLTTEQRNTFTRPNKPDKKSPVYEDVRRPKPDTQNVYHKNIRTDETVITEFETVDRKTPGRESINKNKRPTSPNKKVDDTERFTKTSTIEQRNTFTRPNKSDKKSPDNEDVCKLRPDTKKVHHKNIRTDENKTITTEFEIIDRESPGRQPINKSKMPTSPKKKIDETERITKTSTTDQRNTFTRPSKPDKKSPDNEYVGRPNQERETDDFYHRNIKTDENRTTTTEIEVIDRSSPGRKPVSKNKVTPSSKQPDTEWITKTVTTEQSNTFTRPKKTDRRSPSTEDVCTLKTITRKVSDDFYHQNVKIEDSESITTKFQINDKSPERRPVNKDRDSPSKKPTKVNKKTSEIVTVEQSNTFKRPNKLDKKSPSPFGDVCKPNGKKFDAGKRKPKTPREGTDDDTEDDHGFTETTDIVYSTTTTKDHSRRSPTRKDKKPNRQYSDDEESSTDDDAPTIRENIKVNYDEITEVRTTKNDSFGNVINKTPLNKKPINTQPKQTNGKPTKQSPAKLDKPENALFENKKVVTQTTEYIDSYCTSRKPAKIRERTPKSNVTEHQPNTKPVNDKTYKKPIPERQSPQKHIVESKTVKNVSNIKQITKTHIDKKLDSVDNKRHVVTATISISPKPKPLQEKKIDKKPSTYKTVTKTEPINSTRVTEVNNKIATKTITHVVPQTDRKVTRTTSHKTIKTSHPIPVRGQSKPELLEQNYKNIETEKNKKNIITTKSITLDNSYEDENEVIINLQRSISSREPTPNRICPRLIPNVEDNTTERYPDEITEPGETFKKPTRLSDISIIESNNLIENEKRTDNVTLQQLGKKPRERDEVLNVPVQSYRPKSPKCENYSDDSVDESFTSVSDKISRFIETAENVQIYTNKSVVDRPNITQINDDIKTDDCLLSVSEKVNKFTAAQNTINLTNRTKPDLRNQSPKRKIPLENVPREKSPSKNVLVRESSDNESFRRYRSDTKNETEYKIQYSERESPSRESPRRESPAREYPRRESPIRDTTRRESPRREPLDRDSPKRESPTRRESFGREYPKRESPTRESNQGYPTRDYPRRESPKRDSPLRECAKQEFPRGKSPESSVKTSLKDIYQQETHTTKFSSVKASKFLIEDTQNKRPREEQSPNREIIFNKTTKSPISVKEIPKSTPRGKKNDSTIITECVQIEDESQTYTRKSTPTRQTPDQKSPTKTVTKKEIYETKTSKPADATPKSTRTLSSVGRLRSTESMKRAKELFENFSKTQTTETTIQKTKKPLSPNKSIKDDYDLKSTHLVMNKVKSTGQVSKKENIPHYMLPLDTHPVEDNLVYDKTPRHRSRSPKSSHPYGSSSEDIPHYMLPLDRTPDEKYNEKMEDDKTPRHHSHDRSSKDTPHYMLPLDRKPDEQYRQRSQSPTTRQSHHTYSGDVPHYMLPLDRNPDEHIKTPRQRSRSPTTGQPYPKYSGNVPHYMLPLDRTPDEHDGDAPKQRSRSPTLRQPYNKYSENVPHYMLPLDRTPDEYDRENKSPRQRSRSPSTGQPYTKHSGSIPHYMLPLDRTPDEHDIESIHRSRSPTTKQPYQSLGNVPHYMLPLDRTPDEHDDETRHRSQSPTSKQLHPTSGSVPHYMMPLDRAPDEHDKTGRLRSQSPPCAEKLNKPSNGHYEHVPHYMLPIAKAPHENHHEKTRSRETTPKLSRGSTPDKHVPSYMKPLEKTVKAKKPTKSTVLETETVQQNGVESVKITKFGVTLRRTSSGRKVISSNDTEISNENEIEKIFDLNILEFLLEQATTYDQRRRIRAQIRVAKQAFGSKVSSKSVDQKVSKSSQRVVTTCVDTSSRKSQFTKENSSKSLVIDRKTERVEKSKTESKPRQKSPEKGYENQKALATRKITRTRDDVVETTQDKPSWVTQKPLKKASDRVVKKSTSTSTKSETVKVSSYESEPIDLITSSYGVGPTDENGRPLFGLKALRAQNQTDTTKVKGTVIRSHFHSENGQEPVGEVSVTKFSNQPTDFGEHLDEDGLVSVTTTQRFGSNGTPSYKTLIDNKYNPEASSTSDSEIVKKSITTKESRRGSVKELSKKYGETTVENVKCEKSGMYPKAGLILRSTQKYADDDQDRLESQENYETVETIKTSSTDTFLTNKTRVSGVQDVITRMKNSDIEYETGESPEDKEAKSLLNKFIGSQVILSGMETVCSSSSPSVRTVKRTTTTTMTTSKEGEKPTTVTRTFVHPITEEELTTVWDEDTLKLLLERSTEYEERRIIRSRLRDVMAEQKVCDEITSKSKEGISEKVEETSQGTVIQGSVTTTQGVTAQKTSVKPVSPFAKFRQLDKQNSINTPPGTPRTPTGSGPLFKFTDPELSRQASTVKERLLQWCQMKTKEYENVQLDNFSSSWADGLAFCALIHHFLPEAFDYHKLTPKERRHNFTLAFRVADEKADIMPLLDVDDMVATRKPDWKCVFTYVQTIYARFKNED